MSANDPVMRAREPADPPTWLDYVAPTIAVFFLAIIVKGLIGAVL